MSLLTKIQTLLHEWFPNKTDDKNNFDTWMNTNVIYTGGQFKVCSECNGSGASNTITNPITLNIDLNDIAELLDYDTCSVQICAYAPQDNFDFSPYDELPTIEEYQNVLNSIDTTPIPFDGDWEEYPILVYMHQTHFSVISNYEYNETTFDSSWNGISNGVINNNIATIELDMEDNGTGSYWLFIVGVDDWTEEDEMCKMMIGEVVNNPNGTIVNFSMPTE